MIELIRRLRDRAIGKRAVAIQAAAKKVEPEEPDRCPLTRWLYLDGETFFEVGSKTTVYFDPLGGDWTFGSKKWHWPSGVLSPLVAIGLADRCIAKGLM